MEAIVLLGLVIVGGWMLGILAFFRAGRARAEVAALRQRVEHLTAGEAPAAQPTAPAADADWVMPPLPAAPTVTEPAPTAPPLTPTQPPPPAAPPPPRIDIETLLTQRWGMWLGAAALLLAGVFLIRYAVEEGLLGPAARCTAAALLGGALVGGAEWLRRHPPAGAAPAALAAGGVATLFGAAYGAGVLYELVPPSIGFALMALAAAAGLLVSLRFGELAAAVGVAGAFVTPALVSTGASSWPGLFVYLLAVTAAALAVVRYAAWTWLGWAATVAGAAWVVVAVVAGAEPDAWAPALFVPAAAALNLALLPPAALAHPVGRRLSWIPFAVLGVAGLLLAASSGGAMPRAGVLLLSPLAVWKGWREPRLDRLPWLAALLFLAVLLIWALPEWQPTGEIVTLEGALQAVLPGAWAPEVIRPLLLTAMLMAAFHAAAGLVLERSAPHPLPWAALAAGVPVLTLLVTYGQVAAFQRDATWALVAGGVAAGLSLAAARARRQNSLGRAGVHAAGTLAALSLGCAMVLHDQWLTLAVALFLPPLAWVEARADLPPLRRLALVVAAFVLIRLLLNGDVLDYGFGTTPVANGLLLAYGLPAAAFTLAAVMFRRRGDDLTVAVLEAGALAFAAALVALQIRHGVTGGDLRGGASFRETAMQVSALAAEAVLLLWRGRRPVPLAAGRLLGGAALVGGIIMVLANPLVTGVPANWTALIAAYLVPALLAVLALRLKPVAPVAPLLAGYAVVAMLLWIGLAVRRGFHPDAAALDAAAVGDVELWAYSGAWLAYGAALIAIGLRLRVRPLRLAALAIIGLVTAKVFLLDMAGLDGLWRVLSFLGLGLALIGLGVVTRRFVIPAPPP